MVLRFMMAVMRVREVDARRATWAWVSFLRVMTSMSFELSWWRRWGWWWLRRGGGRGLGELLGGVGDGWAGFHGGAIGDVSDLGHVIIV